ncbi:hypothetical protein K2P97_08425 [bacterium]|nr:hypothetical protein [bacterium]
MKKILLAIFSIFIFAKAHARIDIEMSRSGSANTSNTNEFSIGYSLDSYVDENSEVVGLNHYLQYGYSNTKTVVNLNSNLADFEFNDPSHNLNYNLLFFEKLSVSFGYGYTNLNNSQAQVEQNYISLYYQFESWQFGASFSKSTTKQLSDIIIINQNYKNQAQYNTNSNTLYLDYQVNQDLIVKLSTTQYSFTENLENFNTLLTAQAFLQRGSAAIANEIQGQIKSSNLIGLTYSINDYWLIDASASQSQDLLNPQEKTNTGQITLNFEDTLLQDSTYSIFGSIYSSKSDSSSTSYSGSFGFGVSF